MQTSRLPKSQVPLILVVEDHDDTRLLYATVLRAAGYVVDTASTGEEAIIAARKLLPFVIVMDLAMPVVDGWRASETLKSDPATKGVWVVAVTARAERHDVDRAYAAGCDAVAFKPVEPAELIRLVETGIARRTARLGS